MTRIIISLIALFQFTNIFSQEINQKSKLSVGLGFVNIQNTSVYFPSSVTPVLLSASYNYNFYKRMSIEAQLKFANGLSHQDYPEGFKLYFYNSGEIALHYSVVKNEKIELNIGGGILESYILYSYPIESPEKHFHATTEFGAAYFGTKFTTNVKYFFNNKSFLAYSFAYGYYPFSWQYKIRTFSNAISFGIQF